jgi:hypothetical protein
VHHHICLYSHFLREEFEAPEHRCSDSFIHLFIIFIQIMTEHLLCVKHWLGTKASHKTREPQALPLGSSYINSTQIELQTMRETNTGEFQLLWE